MLYRISPLSHRGGTVAPLAALLMTFLTGMLAFSIDVGYICSVQAELQDAADAAALAGAEQIQSQFIAYFSPGQTSQQSIYNTVTTDTSNSSSPIPTAQQYAYYNLAGGVKVKVPTSDVSFSYYNGTTFSAPSNATGLFPNTINVTTRRDGNANGALGLFFGQIFGISTVNLTATASATIYNGPMTSLTTTPPFTTSGSGGTTSTMSIDAHILPVALDMYVWANFASGNSSSAWLSGVVSTGSNGLSQLQVYPTGTNTPGSFGLIDVGTPSNSTPAFESWIDDGSTPNDIAYLLNNNLLPVSPSSPEPWKCGPGLKSALLSSFESVMGESVLIPLFQPVTPAASTPPPSSPGSNYVAETGNGQGATYAVVGFAAVTITQATGHGSNMNISIQPSAFVSPTAIISNPLPAATVTQQSSFSSWSTSSASYSSATGTVFTTFVPAKLTR
jgi:Flp pilus assembly protein TadG